MKMGLPLSKICDLTGDAEGLAPYYAEVDRYPDALDGQHPIRRWEYAMALQAIRVWQEQTVRSHRSIDPPLAIMDVGGAGSQFWQVLTGLTDEPIHILDPNPSAPRPHHIGGVWERGTLEQYASVQAHNQWDILTCISVIEHIPGLSPFFHAAYMLLKPGGLLFLTTDCWDADGPDTAHFHWMRERIYNPESLRQLRTRAHHQGFFCIGSVDWTYHGPQVYDYAVASMTLRKV